MRLVGVQLPQSLYDEIHARGPCSSLESVIRLIHGCICRFSKPKGVDNTGLLAWLLAQSQGVYVCEYGGRLAGHCVTWDAERRYVVDTDSRYRGVGSHLYGEGISCQPLSFQEAQTTHSPPSDSSRHD